VKRTEMLEKARQRAYEMIDESSCLDNEHFKELKVLPEETAINKLAVEFLEEALANNEMEDEEPTADEDFELDLDDEDTGW